MRRARRRSASAVPPSALRDADVLLYRGRGTISKLIRLFDGSEVSHAGLHRDGATVAEALGKGLTRRALGVSVRHNEWVSAHRLAATPDLAPVARRCDRYLADPHRYAYEQIVLLAMLGALRRVPVRPVLASLLRRLFDSAADLLLRWARRREPLICSEFVYRCYAEAVAGDRDPYELRIPAVRPRRDGPALRAARARVGSGIERGSLLDRARRAGPRARRVTPAPRERRGLAALGEAYLASLARPVPRAARAVPLAEVEPELTRFLDALVEAQRPRTGRRRARARPTLRAAAARAARSQAVANFVTPGDLLACPDLDPLGRLGGDG